MSEDMLQLNITTVGTNVKHKGKTNVKLKRRDRMKRKRQESESADLRAAAADVEPESVLGAEGQRASKQAKIDASKPIHASSKSPSQPKGKFSSLFTNNPDIPHIESAPVDPVQENVFSKVDFSGLELHPYMVTNLKKLGFTEMTSVQKASIPHIIDGVDILIKSQTGSGKTLAYAIPVVEQLQGAHPKVCRSDGPYAINIVPTRELALQSFETFQKLIQPFHWIVPGCIVGGEKRKSEKARLRKGVNILVATPGRLLDHLHQTASLTLRHVRWLIIDEADRMLDMGFEKAVAEVINILKERGPPQRQTLLLSATLSPKVEQLAGISLHAPVRVDITHSEMPAPAVSQDDVSSDTEDTVYSTPTSLQHHYIVVPSKLRLVTLTSFILLKCKYSSKREKMIIFVSTQDAVDFHHTLLTQILNRSSESDEEEEDDEGKDAESHLQLFKLHGDMPQKERTKVFTEFSETRSGILFCTDVAARGLDLPHVRWIVQYDPPGTPTDYIHRVGRTARAGSKGRAIIFLTPAEVGYIQVLNKHAISLEEVKMDDILKTLLLEASSLPSMPSGQVANTSQESATSLQKKFEKCVQDDIDLRNLSRKAYQSFVRAYATYPSHLRHIFHVKTLHLGHMAKSFALQDDPTKIGTLISKSHKHIRKKGQSPHNRLSWDKSKKSGTKHKSSKALLLSEFSSGL